MENKQKTTTVSEYIENAPEWAKNTLQQLRKIIKKTAPKTEEKISYGIPYYSQNGRVAYFGVHTQHCSFHWITNEEKKSFKNLENATIKGNTIQILKGEKVPAELITQIVKKRIQENLQK